MGGIEGVMFLILGEVKRLVRRVGPVLKSDQGIHVGPNV